MKRSHVVLLTVTAGVGLLLVLLSIAVGRSAPTLAAPQVVNAFVGLPGEGLAPSYQGVITCSLNITTTDSLASAHNNTSTTAAPLSNYSGLALAVGNKDQDAPAQDDWFRLDNANPGSTYVVEAIPDKTTNYNLGIVVYDASLVEIDRDADTVNFSAKVELEATGHGPYFFRVYQLTPGCTGDTYHLSFSRTDPTPSLAADSYEPNDNVDEARAKPALMGASVTLEDLNFRPYQNRPGPDEDWFAFRAKAGRWYEATTGELVRADTYMEIHDQNDIALASNDDYGEGYASQIKWQASYDGNYFIRIINRFGASGSDGIYSLTVEELGATATPTQGPTSTPQPTATGIPGLDQYEPNYDFDHATTIATGITYDANFIPWGGGGEDNDFYKLWVKPGLHFTCETLELAPGVDTNMIVYDGNRSGIGGNDDVTLGDYRSRFAYFSTYVGWLYVLVGHGGRLPASELKNSSYKLRCELGVPGQATATSTPEPGGAPETPSTEEPEPATATPALPAELTVRALTTPTPAPATTPVPRFIPISLLVYYDAVDDQQPGAGEGIAGISAQAYEVATNQLLAQGFTDAQGSLEFTVTAQGLVRVSVPFFGFSQLVAGKSATIYLRVPPQALPGGGL